MYLQAVDAQGLSILMCCSLARARMGSTDLVQTLSARSNSFTTCLFAWWLSTNIDANKQMFGLQINLRAFTPAQHVRYSCFRTKTTVALGHFSVFVSVQGDI